ncbi:MAG: sulfite exporter TauE/SafE family protein [Burkholderiales bacterium]|nr:sulfite exporter TauE/SafE family protein [Burkholderiales bacterium]
MTAVDIVLIVLGGFAAGAANSVAGGGSFFSFPAMLAAGVPPVVANASNSVALWPGSLAAAWGYRAELVRMRAHLLGLSVAALAGGMAGGLLLLAAGDAQFAQLIPWLLAFATGLFAASPQIATWLKSRRERRAAADATAAPTAHSNSVVGWLAQCLVSVYGGFFGAGMGILMMASLSIAGHEDLHEVNALKNLLSSVVYSITVATFITAGAISWPHTLIMLVAASAGGYLGVRLARRLQGPWLRRIVIAVGAALTAYYFFKTPG